MGAVKRRLKEGEQPSEQGTDPGLLGMWDLVTGQAEELEGKGGRRGPPRGVLAGQPAVEEVMRRAQAWGAGSEPRVHHLVAEQCVHPRGYGGAGAEE